MSDNLYTYQRRVMPILLGWGIGSIVSGLIWLLGCSQKMRGMGSQFFGWGLVDSLIAIFAIASADRKTMLLESGEVTPGEHLQQAVQFERFVWFNALLDIGYVIGGIRLAKRSPQEPRRRGIGWGILIQGAFLFVWDVLLAVFAGRLRRGL
jgi:hypothetical protein